MLHTIQLYYNKKGFSEATTLYTRRGDTGELLSATFKDEIDELLVLPEGSTTFDVSKVYFEAEGNGVFVRREVPAKYLDLTTPKKPRIKNFPMPAEMFAKGPNVVDNCYFRFELKTGAPTLDTESPVTVSSSSFNTIVLGSPIPGIRSYYLDEIDYLIKEFEKAIEGYTPADIEAFYAELKAEIELAKKQAKQDIEDLNALFVQSEADLRAKIVREIADMNKLIQNMQTSLDAQLLELQKQIDATKLQVTEIDKHLVQVDLDITNAKNEIEQVKIDTTAEINQVKEDTAAQITKVKNDASTEINKIKTDTINAVVAEKQAVIKMINDLKAEIAAMDLEQLVLDLFAQGKVKDVMVAEIQKEVTKQLSDKGAASQTWVEENFISSDSKKNNIKTSNLFSYQDIVPSGLVSVIKENSALFSGWANVFVYNAKLPLYLTEGKEYTISYKYIPRKMTENTIPAAQANHGCLALYSYTTGLFKPLYDVEEVKNQKIEIDKPLYRTIDFVCPKITEEKIDLIAYATRQMTPDGKTFVVTDSGEFVDVMITEKGVQGEWSIPERDLTSSSLGYRWYDSATKLASGRTSYNLLVKESTDWKYVATPSNLPEGVTGGGFHRSVFISDTYGFVEFVSQRDSSTYINSMAGGAWQGWKKTTMDGQVQKITSDNGDFSRINDATKTTIQAIKELGVGMKYVYLQKTKDAPVANLLGISLYKTDNFVSFTGVSMYDTNTTYQMMFDGIGEPKWARLDGQVAKITRDDGSPLYLLNDGFDLLTEIKRNGRGFYTARAHSTNGQLPSNESIYLITVFAAEVTTNGVVNHAVMTAQSSNDSTLYTQSVYVDKLSGWKKAGSETSEYPKTIPIDSITMDPVQSERNNRTMLNVVMINETTLEVDIQVVLLKEVSNQKTMLYVAKIPYNLIGNKRAVTPLLTKGFSVEKHIGIKNSVQPSILKINNSATSVDIIFDISSIANELTATDFMTLTANARIVLN